MSEESHNPVPQGGLSAGADERHGGIADMHSDDLIDLARLWHILRRHQRTIILTVLFCMGIGLLYLFVAPRIYSSTSTLELHVRRPRIVGEEGAYLGEDSGGSSAVADALNTQFHKLRSKLVRDTAVAEMMRHRSEIPELAQYTSETLAFFLENTVNIDRVSGTYLVSITAYSPSRNFASLVADAYGKAAVETVKDSTRQSSMEAVEWLEEQIDVYEKEVLKHESRLIGFRQKRNLDGLLSSKVAAAESLLAVNQSLIEYQTRSSVLNDMVASLSETGDDMDVLSTLPSSVPRAEAIQQSLRIHYDAVMNRDVLLTHYTDKHPKVVGAQKVADDTLGQLETEIARAKETAKADLALVNAYVKSIHSNKVDVCRAGEILQAQIDNINTEMIPLRRELEASDSSYKGLLSRIEQARMATDEDTSMLTMYQAAIPSRKPVKPRKRLILFLVVMAGGAIGVGLALAEHVLQDRVADMYDLEIEMRQNVLGVIPHVDGKLETKEMGTAILRDKFSPITEAISTLRAALIAQGHKPETGGWVILVSSAGPGAGKSTTSCNLAIAMAKSFNNVIVIDGDMRRPKLHHVFGMEKKGLSLMEALMQGDSDDSVFEQLPHVAGVDNLSVVSGQAVADVSPVEVLETGAFERMINWARSKYDVVIIDSPPMGIIGDALIYGRAVDDMVLMARFDKTRKSMLRHAIKDVQKHGLPLTGVVMNDYQSSGSSVYSGYGGYGHYYNSSYSSYYGKGSKS